MDYRNGFQKTNMIYVHSHSYHVSGMLNACVLNNYGLVLLGMDEIPINHFFKPKKKSYKNFTILKL